MPASPIQVRVIGPHLHLFGQCVNHARRRMRARKRQDRGAGARSRSVLEPRVIMSILGHSTILLTMNTYAMCCRRSRVMPLMQWTGPSMRAMRGLAT
jgi:hypothetical protein